MAEPMGGLGFALLDECDECGDEFDPFDNHGELSNSDHLCTGCKDAKEREA